MAGLIVRVKYEFDRDGNIKEVEREEKEWRERTD